MIGAVLFDIDGTLIDSNELHVEAWRQVFAEAGHEVESAAIRQQIGKGGDKLVPTLLPSVGENEQKALTTSHGRLFRQVFLPQAAPFPQARKLIEHVAQEGRDVLLASSASQEELRHYIDLLETGDVIAGMTSIDDVEQSKPAPDIFSVARQKAGVAAEEAVAVGDTPYDALSAGKAGMGTVAVLSGGFSSSELKQAGASAIYEDVADLLAQYEGSPLDQ